MNRIELDEEIDSEQYEKKQFKPLELPSVARFKVKPVSNQDHSPWRMRYENCGVFLFPE